MRKLFILALLILPAFASAQTVRLAAGDSSLFQSSGGSVQLFAPNGETGTFGAGTINGRLMFGGNVSKDVDDVKITGGDVLLPFGLATDSYSGFGFLGRGVLISPLEQKWGGGYSQPTISGTLHPLAAAMITIIEHCKVFIGESSVGYGVPFFQASKASEPLGYARCSVPVAEHWNLFANSAFSSKQTALVSLQYQRDGITAAGTAGIGNNTPYASILGKFENAQRTVFLKSSYTKVSNDFRRVIVSAPLLSENTGLNFEGAWIPLSGLRLNASHSHVLSPLTNGSVILPGIKASINSQGAYYTVRKLDLHIANYSSTASGVHNSGQDYGAGYRLTNTIGVRTEYLKSKQSDIWINSVSERYRRLEFTENVTQSSANGQKQTGFDGGVSYHGNGMTVTAEYQELYFPFVPANQSPFRRVFSLSLQKNIGDATIVAQTYVDPQNRMKFTVSGSDYFYGPRAVDKHTFHSGHLGRWLIAGQVVDHTGQPVFGAALRFDSEQIIYSGQDGRFFIRLHKAKTAPVVVATSEFIEGHWQVSSAPAVVSARLESESQPIKIIVERM
jgi:hypothetical protein